MNLKEEIARKRAMANAMGVNDSNNTPALITDITSQDSDAIILMIDQVEVKQQGRKTFNDLLALALDIKTVGQLQPIIVKQIDKHRYRLIAGERRYRAMKHILKARTIRATIRRADESEMETRFVQISENTQRDDYLPLELAAELASLKTQSGFSIEQMASRIGKSKGFVSKYINLLEAPVDVVHAISKGEVAATAWFNNKTLVLQQLKEPTPKSVATTINSRISTVAVSVATAKDMVKLLQKLTVKNGLANIDVDLTGPVTKKQLQVILTSRTNEVLKSL